MGLTNKTKWETIGKYGTINHVFVSKHGDTTNKIMMPFMGMDNSPTILFRCVKTEGLPFLMPKIMIDYSIGGVNIFLRQKNICSNV